MAVSSYLKDGCDSYEGVSDGLDSYNGPTNCYREPPLKRCKNSEINSWLHTHLQHYIQNPSGMSSVHASNEDHYGQPIEYNEYANMRAAPQRPQQYASTTPASGNCITSCTGKAPSQL